MTLSRQARREQANLAKGLCRCGRFERVPARGLCAGCLLKKRRLNRTYRKPKLPKFTDAQLRQLHAENERAARVAASS